MIFKCEQTHPFLHSMVLSMYGVFVLTCLSCVCFATWDHVEISTIYFLNNLTSESSITRKQGRNELFLLFCRIERAKSKILSKSFFDKNLQIYLESPKLITNKISIRKIGLLWAESIYRVEKKSIGSIVLALLSISISGPLKSYHQKYT